MTTERRYGLMTLTIDGVEHTVKSVTLRHTEDLRVQVDITGKTELCVTLKFTGIDPMLLRHLNWHDLHQQILDAYRRFKKE